MQGLEVKHTHTNYRNTHSPAARPPLSCNKKQQFEQADLIWLNSSSMEQPEMNKKIYQLPTKAIKPTRLDEQVPFSVHSIESFFSFNPPKPQGTEGWCASIHKDCKAGEGCAAPPLGGHQVGGARALSRGTCRNTPPSSAFRKSLLLLEMPNYN